jgi:hypothetical protein
VLAAFIPRLAPRVGGADALAAQALGLALRRVAASGAGAGTFAALVDRRGGDGGVDGLGAIGSSSDCVVVAGSARQGRRSKTEHVMMMRRRPRKEEEWPRAGEGQRSACAIADMSRPRGRPPPQHHRDDDQSNRGVGMGQRSM